MDGVRPLKCGGCFVQPDSSNTLKMASSYTYVKKSWRFFCTGKLAVILYVLHSISGLLVPAELRVCCQSVCLSIRPLVTIVNSVKKTVDSIAMPYGAVIGWKEKTIY